MAVALGHYPEGLHTHGDLTLLMIIRPLAVKDASLAAGSPVFGLARLGLS